MNKVIPFRMGDVCTYIGPKKGMWKGEHIIEHAMMDNSHNKFTYSTSQGAWIPHSELKLKTPANKKSLKALFKVRQDLWEFD